jgi:hypothetical protein
MVIARPLIRASWTRDRSRGMGTVGAYQQRQNCCGVDRELGHQRSSDRRSMDDEPVTDGCAEHRLEQLEVPVPSRPQEFHPPAIGSLDMKRMVDDSRLERDPGNLRPASQIAPGPCATIPLRSASVIEGQVRSCAYRRRARARPTVTARPRRLRSRPSGQIHSSPCTQANQPVVQALEMSRHAPAGSAARPGSIDITARPVVISGPG